MPFSSHAKKKFTKSDLQARTNKWKSVPIQHFLTRDVDTNGVIQLEELDADYEIIKDGDGVQLIINEGTKKSEMSQDNNMEETKKSKKRKRNKKESSTLDSTEEGTTDIAIQFAVNHTKKAKSEDSDDIALDELVNSFTSVEPPTSTELESENTVSLPDWSDLQLHPLLLKAIQDLKFESPTPVQKGCLPPAILARKDIIGAAETGSGKTLAFGLPILHNLLNEVKPLPGLRALVLTPTRELAIQVTKHLTEVAKYTKIKIVPIVGGMSSYKQQRLIDSHPQIIVATPGRLWELISTSHSDSYLWNLHSVSFLVLDEADRMVQTGHFREMHSILSMLPKFQDTTSKTADDASVPEAQLPEELKILVQEQKPLEKPRQTFVFSATLTLKHTKITHHKIHKQSQTNTETWSAVDRVLNVVDFQRKIEAVDLTNSHIIAENLIQAKMECTDEEKDYYMYGFLKQYPGRTIVFVNAISNIRRILPLFSLLQIPVWGLHASMQQRQRLKNLDRFRSSTDGVLVATDVAARGLDIPAVQHVIHYQLPSVVDTYVHRSGRTARAHNVGVSLMLVSPADLPNYKKIVAELKTPVVNFPFDMTVMKTIKSRVNLARTLEGMMHEMTKFNREEKWEAKAKKDLDADDNDDADENLPFVMKTSKLKIESMKKQLNNMLASALSSKGLASKKTIHELIKESKETAYNVVLNKIGGGANRKQ